MSCEHLPTPAVRVRGLRYAYPDGRVALDGLDLDVAAGERLAIIGPNGAGKTTLVLHLAGLLRPRAGEIHVGEACRERDLRMHVGLVFQDPDDQLFMPTVLEDLMFGPRNQGLDPEEAHERAMEALRSVGMEGVEDRSPHQLSMGQRRRVAIATVLAMRPPVLVLDEPSANLDPRARRDLLGVLGAIDHTQIVVTHDLPLAAELCDRAAILSGGRIVAQGPIHEILADAPLLAEHDLEMPYGYAGPSRLPACPARSLVS